MKLCATEKEPSLTHRTVSGAAWSAFGRIATQILNLLVMTVAARLLNPRIYGLFGMARLATGLIEIFRDLGISSALIQRKTVTPELLSSVFWMNLILGIIMTFTAVYAAPYVGAFYHEPKVIPIVRALAGGFTLMSVGGVPAALLAREMAFKKIVLIETAVATLSAVITISAIALGAGVWGLVIPVLTGAGISTFLFWSVSRWTPSLQFHWRDIRSVASFSLNLSGFNIVNYFNRNADNAIVGRYLGAAQLGFYQLAYSIMLYAVQNLTTVLGRVLFPAFTKVQDDNRRFKNAYVKGVSMLALITFPLMAGIMGVSEPFVGVVLGTKWRPVSSLLVILAPVGLMQSVIATVGHIYFVKGRTDWMFRWGLVSSAVVVPSFFLGLHWGIRGVALAYLIANLILLYPALAIPFRLIDLKINEFARPLWQILGCSVVMLTAIWLVRSQISSWPPAIQLGTLLSTGVLIYSSIILTMRPEALTNVLSIRDRWVAHKTTAKNG